MKLWAIIFAVGAFAQDEGGSRADMTVDYGTDRGERGPKECQENKLRDINGVKWICSARTTKKLGQRRHKKCRGFYITYNCF